MNILVTGGAGFVGQRLIAALLDLPAIVVAGEAARPIEQIICFDRIGSTLSDPRLRTVIGDMTDPALINSLVTDDIDLIFHLAAIVSGSAEADFDLGMQINLHGSMTLLEAARQAGHCPQLVFSSSIAVFGGELPSVITDSTMPVPQGSYGVQKVIVEQLVQDYSRKGFIRGCSLRLPGVLVRPGEPNGAASGFSSAIIREPLAGRQMVLPVPARTAIWAASPATVCANLIHAAGLTQRDWGPNRSLNLPGNVVAMTEALEALELIGGSALSSKVSIELDPDVMALVDTWAFHFETPRALALGFRPDPGFIEMVAQYIRENPGAIKARCQPEKLYQGKRKS